MKLLTVVLLVCLLVAGTASAAAVSPGSVVAVKTIVPVSTQKIPATSVHSPVVNYIAGSIITIPPQDPGQIYTDTYPHGAAITIDGYTYPGDKTPGYHTVVAGTRTVVLSLEGYQDYSTTITLNAGETQVINVSLTRKLATDIGRANIAAIQAPEAGGTSLAPLPAGAIVQIPVTGLTRAPVFNCDDLPMGVYHYQCMLPSDAAQTFGGGWQYITDKPCGYETLSNGTMLTKYCCEGAPRGTVQHTGWDITTAMAAGQGIPVVTTAATSSCPNSDWTCLSPAEAVQQFGDSNARYGNQPCQYVQVNNRTVARYCYMDVDTGGSLPAGALRAAGIQKDEDIYIANASWVQHAVVNTLPETGQGSGGAAPGPLQPVFDFFSSLFGGVPKPAPNLQLVELNPCPEPPMGEGVLPGK